MYFLYSVLQILGLVLGFPYFLYQALAHKKYIASIRERLGKVSPALKPNDRKTVWIHACSVGETLAAVPLIFYLSKTFPSLKIVLSTITVTGHAVARSRFINSAQVFYFPYDFQWIVNRVVDHIGPKLVIILETEIWPNFLRACRRRGIPVVLANGRLSERSFRGYRLIRRFIRRVLDNFVLLIMQSEGDARRIQSLGVPPNKLIVSGNIKYDRDDTEKSRVDEVAAHLDNLFDLSQGPPLIVAGSTHPGEESILLGVLREIRRHPTLNSTRLLIAPRHPERFDEVANLIRSAGLNLVRRSERDKNHFADVILLDSIGELGAVYRYARVVFIGGTLVASGGHSIIEPALYARPILIGPHMEHFPEVLSDFSKENAVWQLSSAEVNPSQKLANAVLELLRNEEESRAMGNRAQAVLMQNRGAIVRTITYITPFLEQVE